MLRFATPTLALVLSGLIVGACATSNEEGALPPPKKQPDAAAFQDTAATDSSGGDAVSDAAPDMGSCAPLTSETKPCGKCGKRTRTCSSSGTWNEWSTCSGEDPSAECSIDEVRAAPCGNCGTQKDTCDPTSCTWSTGVCLGEGACAAGDVETSTASCPTVGEVRTRTCTDKCAWSAYSDCTLPKGWLSMSSAPTGFEGRYWHSAVWTGSKMIVWGGYGTYAAPSYVYVKPSGAAYDLAGDAWTTIAAPPSALSSGRWHHSGVWTGTQMIVWGGLNNTSYTTSSYYTNTGAIYDPSTNTWPKTVAATSLTPRYDHVGVWSTTTNEMLIWGGMAYGSTYAPVNDGAAYDPATDTWTPMPASPLSPRYRASAVWTGTELIIWGGLSTTSTTSGILRDGARYDPKTKVWTKFPDPPAELDARWDNAQVWSGKEMLVWGGVGSIVGSSYGRSDGARYMPGGSWTRFTVPSDDIFATGTQATRAGVQAWYGNGKLWMWSGAPVTSSSYVGSPTTGGGYIAAAGGVSYDPSTDKWTTMDVTGAPTIARAHASVVWTGKEAIIWGGSNYGSGSTYYADGGIYRP